MKIADLVAKVARDLGRWGVPEEVVPVAAVGIARTVLSVASAGELPPKESLDREIERRERNLRIRRLATCTSRRALAARFRLSPRQVRRIVNNGVPAAKR